MRLTRKQLPTDAASRWPVCGRAEDELELDGPLSSQLSRARELLPQEVPAPRKGLPEKLWLTVYRQRLLPMTNPRPLKVVFYLNRCHAVPPTAA